MELGSSLPQNMSPPAVPILRRNKQNKYFIHSASLWQLYCGEYAIITFFERISGTNAKLNLKLEVKF